MALADVSGVGCDLWETGQLFSELQESLGTILTWWWLYLRTLTRCQCGVRCVHMYVCTCKQDWKLVILYLLTYLFLYRVSGKPRRCWLVCSAPFTACQSFSFAIKRCFLKKPNNPASLCLDDHVLHVSCQQMVEISKSLLLIVSWKGQSLPLLGAAMAAWTSPAALCALWGFFFNQINSRGTMSSDFPKLLAWSHEKVLSAQICALGTNPDNQALWFPSFLYIPYEGYKSPFTDLLSGGLCDVHTVDVKMVHLREERSGDAGGLISAIRQPH